jgi:hypothetical protein
MLKRCQTQNPDIIYPSNMGQKWTYDEEILLLEELNNNIDIETIAQKHNRTIGGINARRREMAYKMHLKHITMEEIINKTKLDKNQIIETIQRRESPKNVKKTPEIKKQFSIETEIIEIKNDIKELKNTIKELVEMMNAVYEFEDT